VFDVRFVCVSEAIGFIGVGGTPQDGVIDGQRLVIVLLLRPTAAVEFNGHEAS
jgi:hypothetical protein